MQNWELAKDMKPLNRINHVQVFFDDGKIDPFTVYELEAINNLIA